MALALLFMYGFLMTRVSLKLYVAASVIVHFDLFFVLNQINHARKKKL